MSPIYVKDRPEPLKNKIEYAEMLKSYEINNHTFPVIEVCEIKSAVKWLEDKLLHGSSDKSEIEYLYEAFEDVVKK